MDLTPTPDDPEDTWEPPAYGTPGWVLVQIIGINHEHGATYLFEIEEYVVDVDHSPFWIIEGVGIKFWMDLYAPRFLHEGWWVFEGVVGTYYRGDGWMTDDDEEWEWALVRTATEEEIKILYVESD